jgi:hypothetical protein
MLFAFMLLELGIDEFRKFGTRKPMDDRTGLVDSGPTAFGTKCGETAPRYDPPIAPRQVTHPIAKMQQWAALQGEHPNQVKRRCPKITFMPSLRIADRNHSARLHRALDGLTRAPLLRLVPCAAPPDFQVIGLFG